MSMKNKNYWRVTWGRSGKYFPTLHQALKFAAKLEAAGWTADRTNAYVKVMETGISRDKVTL